MPKRKTKLDAGGSFEGTVSVCVHNVAFRYWGFRSDLTPDLEERLAEEAESRAQDCIIRGFHSGELNCLYVSDDDTEEEIRGWWEINK